jgi:BirA family biotin operon repressor/biotin-[acetyl-CoA-carboxylase] ligase
MICYTGDEVYARRIFPDAGPWTHSGGTEPVLPGNLKTMSSRLLGTPCPARSRITTLDGWLLFCTEHSSSSQYDRVLDLLDEGCDLPDRVACLAGSGENFHGQRGRPWAAAAGNIHLTVHLRPERTIPDFGVGFPLLAAVSVIETVDELPGLAGASSLKWVNDILIGSAKVAGFVAHVQSREDKVRSAVLGVGLNVETVPPVEPTPYVPQVTSLKARSPHPETCRLGPVLIALLTRLNANYRILCAGDTRSLLDFYRSRSSVLGREVRVMSDPLEGPEREAAQGRVTDIGDRLELFVEGCARPLHSGRVILLG